MSRRTKAELERENAQFRGKLEALYDELGEFLEVDDSDEEESDEGDEDEDETDE